MTNRYINYFIILYAFSFPVSKAAVNILEAVILLLWIYEGNWKEKLRLLQSSLFIRVLGLFLLYSLLSVLWASDTEFALQYIGKYHHFLMIPVIYTALQKRYIPYVFSAFVLSVFVSELMSYGIFFHLFTYKGATAQFPTPFMHHITYSVILAFTGAILLTNLFTAKEYKYKLFNMLFFITVTINLFINGGRTGQVAFMALMGLLPFLLIKHKIKAAVLAFSIIFTSFFLAYTYSDNFTARIDQFEKGVAKIFNSNDYTDQGGMRAALWIVGADIFMQHPVKGTGIGNAMKEANLVASEHGFKHKNMNEFADYHNMFLNEAVELGSIGLLLVLFVLYALLRLKFETKQYFILNTMFVLSFVIFSMTHNTLHLMNPMVFFALFSGLFLGISRIENHQRG